MNKIIQYLSFIAFLIFITDHTLPQSFNSKFSEDKSHSTNNFAITLGYINYFVLDGYISPNEYTGHSILYGFSWGDVNCSRIVQISAEFNKSDNLKHNVSTASNYNFWFDYKHLFFITESTIFSKPTGFYLGPGLSFFLYDRSQRNVPLSSQVETGAVNLNVRSRVYFSENISISASLAVSLVGFGKHNVDEIGTTEKSTTDILSLFSMQNIEAGLECKYAISNFLFLQADYTFSYMNTSKWDTFRITADNFLLRAGISF